MQSANLLKFFSESAENFYLCTNECNCVMVVKTREKLIEVARQLFAHKGVANTTMNDIAAASDKGRRTIYTYFKNKKEIYNAVLETESDHMVTSLREIVAENAPVDVRLRRFLMSRLEHGRTISSAYTSLKSWLKFDVRRMERIHRLVAEKEHALLAALLREGIRAGLFDADRCALLDGFINQCISGLDLSNIDSAGSADYAKAHAAFVDFVITDIMRKS